jgi:plastocyanin
LIPPARLGVSRAATVVALILIVAVGGVAYGLLSRSGSGSGTSTKTSTTTVGSGSNAAGSLQVSTTPPIPLISPGETQNYTLLELSGGPSTGSLSLSVFAPDGLSFLLNQSSISLSADNEPIPVVLKAGSSLSPGNYSVKVESTAGGSTTNHTIDVDVVPLLIVMLNVAFHPDNATVPVGTRVTWMNLDSTIGCCDPGYHNVSFRTIVNETSPDLMRLETWSYDFGTPGDYLYICTIHPWMTGQVNVET